MKGIELKCRIRELFKKKRTEKWKEVNIVGTEAREDKSKREMGGTRWRMTGASTHLEMKQYDLASRRRRPEWRSQLENTCSRTKDRGDRSNGLNRVLYREGEVTRATVTDRLTSFQTTTATDSATSTKSDRFSCNMINNASAYGVTSFAT